MKRFTGETSNGMYTVTLIDNSVHVEYVGLSGDTDENWEAQKTEFRSPTPEFLSIERTILGAGYPDDYEHDFGDDGEVEDPITCRVSEGDEGESELTVTLTNTATRWSVEWTFTRERPYGPIYSDHWNTVLRDIVDGMA